MQEQPLVSLLIISYNQKAYIRDCMEGLLAQTYPNLEILYLDDCSPDQTFEVAIQYENILRQKYGDGRIRFIENRDNQGLIKNLNRLVAESTGDYVKFMSVDDFMFADAVEKIVMCMEAHPEYDMLYTNGIYGDDSVHFSAEFMRTSAGMDKADGGSVASNASDLNRLYDGIQPSGSGQRLFEELYHRDFIAAPTVIVRRNVYERCGMYDDRIGIEDWDFYLRIAEKGCIGYLDEVTVMYRFTNDSLSHSDNPVRRMNMQKSMLLIREKYKDKVKGSREMIGSSLNEAFQDAVHIGNEEYFRFLREYAGRNCVRISRMNRMRYLLYRMHILKVLKDLGC